MSWCRHGIAQLKLSARKTEILQERFGPQPRLASRGGGEEKEEEEDKEEEEEEEEKQSRPQMPPSPKKEKHIGPGEQVAPTPCSPVSACPGAAFSPTLGCRQSHEFWFYLPLPSTCLSPGESRGVRSLGLNKVLRQCDLVC